ncbi:MAG: CobD/CbiB family protein [Burkholderiaceae bacterium]|nr:MAG: CobD/CbiB family protein [Burkholderiaceae bacterium]
MSFFAVFLALVLEQLKPLRRGNWVHESLVQWSRWTGRNFDAGKAHHAWVVWGVTVIVPALLVTALYELLRHHSFILGLLWDVGVVYLTLGFRQFSHYYTDIRDALERSDDTEARRLLAEWRHMDASELPRTELLRHVIEHSLLAAHRHVFGVFFWFIVGSSLGLGPVGAVLYRMSEFAARYWAYKSHVVGIPTNETLRDVSVQCFGIMDFVPARLTAFGFAVVGNFEEAIDTWRRHASLWTHLHDGVILASAAGALGLSLGGSPAPSITPDRSKTFDEGGDPEELASQGSTPGPAPQMAHLSSVVGLVWRSVVLWMLLLLMLTLANLLG